VKEHFQAFISYLLRAPLDNNNGTESLVAPTNKLDYTGSDSIRQSRTVGSWQTVLSSSAAFCQLIWFASAYWYIRIRSTQ